MKKSITLLLFFCFLFSFLQAQSKWHIGPSLTLGFSGAQKIKTNAYDYGNFYLEDYKRKILPTFGAGLAIERTISKRWGLNLGLQYSYVQRYIGSEAQSFSALGIMTSYSKTKNKLIVQQIQTPLQLQFYFGKQDQLRPFISIGGLATYSLVGKQFMTNLNSFGGEVYKNSWDEKINISTDDWSRVSQFNVAMLYGIGLAFEDFTLEVNRTQKVLTEKSNYIDDYRLYDSFYNPQSNSVHATTITIRYWL